MTILEYFFVLIISLNTLAVVILLIAVFKRKEPKTTLTIKCDYWEDVEEETEAEKLKEKLKEQVIFPTTPLSDYIKEARILNCIKEWANSCGFSRDPHELIVSDLLKLPKEKLPYVRGVGKSTEATILAKIACVESYLQREFKDQPLKK